jgi:leader peptidase (prepilin peptidase) / N-methyltransferase
MTFELAALSLFPGLAIGSFLNVVAARVPLRRSIVFPGSACMSCGSSLAWYDNLPLVSFAVLRGRCRHCSAPISWRYPVVELTTAVLIAGCALRFNSLLHAAIAAVFCGVLVTVAATDLETRTIPNRIIVPAAVILVVAQTLRAPSLEWVAGAVGAGAFLLLAALAYPGGMGMGDVKLALVLGAVLGRTASIALFAAMLAALVPAVILLARHGGAARKMAIPFGPFLALGGVLALFAGNALLNAYLKVL